MKMRSLIFLTAAIFLAGCFPKKVSVNTNQNPVSKINNESQDDGKGWKIVGDNIQGMKGLKSDYKLYQFGDEVYMLPNTGCITEYNYDKETGKLNKTKNCESLIYKITETGLKRLPPLELDQSLKSITKWNGKILLAALKTEKGIGDKYLSHAVIYELDENSNSWKIFAPYGFTKKFYPQKTGNGVICTEIGGIPGGPLYFIYGEPEARVTQYKNGSWSFVNRKKNSDGWYAGEEGHIIDGKFYFSFLDAGSMPNGPRVIQVDAEGNVSDHGQFPFTTAANVNVAFSGDGTNFIVITGKARKENETFPVYEVWTLVNNKWEPMTKIGLPNNLTHYDSYTYKGEFYITARIAPPTGSVYNAKASVYKFNGTQWVPVGNKNFTSLMPNFTKLFAMNGSLYLIYSNQKEGGYTLMRLFE
jgi:hypothetical protein